MKTFFIRIIPPRPTFDKDASPAEQALMNVHFVYWKDLFDKGVCVFGGQNAVDTFRVEHRSAEDRRRPCQKGPSNTKCTFISACSAGDASLSKVGRGGMTDEKGLHRLCGLLRLRICDWRLGMELRRTLGHQNDTESQAKLDSSCRGAYTDPKPPARPSVNEPQNRPKLRS